jgi:hypothetical protein
LTQPGLKPVIGMASFSHMLNSGFFFIQGFRMVVVSFSSSMNWTEVLENNACKNWETAVYLRPLKSLFPPG